MKKFVCVFACLTMMFIFAGFTVAGDKKTDRDQVKHEEVGMNEADVEDYLAYRQTGESHKCAFRDAQCYEVKCDNGSRFYYYYNTSKGQYCTGTTFETCMSDLGKLLKYHCGE